MKTRWLLLLAMVGLGAAWADDGGLARDLAAAYQPATSRVMARHVASPTRAALDLATWDGNNLLAANPLSAVPPRRVDLARLSLGGALVEGSAVPGPAQAPLTPDERARPLALEPLLEYLANWDYDIAEPLLLAVATAESDNWGLPDRVEPCQKLTRAYLQATPSGLLVWVDINFAPGLDPARATARLKLDALSPKLTARLRDDYLARVLPPDEVAKYFSELCAKWYPKLRTYLLKAEEMRPWPTAETEGDALAELKGRRFDAPTVVMHGKPREQTLYNVFIVEPPATPTPAGLPDDPMAANLARWRDELAQHGGSWAAWSEQLAPFRADVQRQLAARPVALKGLVGRDGFLFFRGVLEYLVAGELRGQPDNKDPYPAIVDYQRQLAAKGIDLLLVLLPTKAEVYPEKLSDKAPADGLVQPWTRKLLLELGEAGVEALDLLPIFLAAKANAAEPLYLPQDTHWSPGAVPLAAKALAERIRAYRWFGDLQARPTAYKTRRAEFTRRGDIVDMLAPAEAVRCRPMKLAAEQVTRADGSFYADDPASPVVMLGDSFCGIYHFEDCQHAGISAHLAKELGLPIDLIMAHGSGPRIRGQLARRGAEAIKGKRLVIWTVASRDLHNYWGSWDKIKVP